MLESHSSRRKDPQLRSAIERIHGDFLHIKSKQNAYFSVLKELCDLAGATFGIAFELNHMGEVVSMQGLVTCTRFTDTSGFKSWLESPCNEKIDANNATKSLFDSAYDNSSIIYLKHQIPEFTLAPKWPKLDSMITIPVKDAKNTLGLLMLCNSSRSYELDLHRRAIPIITTLVSMLRVIISKNEDATAIKNLVLEKDVWRENFQNLEFSAPIGMLTLNNHYEIVRLNPMGEKILKVFSTNLIGKNINILFPERFPHEHVTQTFKHLNNTSPLRLTAVNAIGEETAVEITVIHYQEFFLPRILLLICDATELQQVKRNMNQELQRFRALADLAPMGILQTDVDWKTSYINSRWLELCGVNQDDMQDLCWCNTFHPDDAETVLTQLHAHLIEGKTYECECRVLRVDNELYWVKLHAQSLFNHQGKVQGFLATIVDNTYVHISEEKLRRLAEEDALTKLANRSLFLARLEHALTRLKRQGAVALLSLDLDGFKNVNDSLGHDAGDILLIQVAERLLACVREIDTVSRIGGDEFNILLEGIAEAYLAAQVAEKILASLTMPFMIKHQEVFISASIGICFAVSGADNSSKLLLKQADLALYRAKAEGKNNYQYFSPELNLASKKKLELGNSLHKALSRTEFEVYYQLQADVITNEIIGLEALMRWNHPTKGTITPDIFIPLLEETGLIIPVSRFVWHSSFFQMHEWLEAGIVPHNAVISVNLSPRQIRDPQLLNSLTASLTDSKLTGEHVVIEITETALLQETGDTLKVLNGFKSLGVKIALDDFGTGYSSLSHLKKYPIDIIKIDKSFVSDVLTDKDDAAIIQAVIALAHSLNLEVVAEGVETDDVLLALRNFGCEHYQGYLLNKPMPAAIIENLLRKHSLEAHNNKCA